MTIQRPKDKGTGGERQLKRRIVDFLVNTGGADRTLAENVVESMPAGWSYDVRVQMPGGPVVEVLAGRADREDWLVTLRLDDFLELWYAGQYPPALNIESKRLARISWHAIFEKKFGRKK